MIRKKFVLNSVYITDTPFGKGVFASKAFQQGELVIETLGELVPERNIYTIQVDWDLHLEPSLPAKYLNHSCEPNLGVKINAHGLPDFYAMRAIQAKEHLTFDYAMTEYTLAERNLPESEWIVCECGADNCRGRLGSYYDLPADVQANYAGYIASYLLTAPILSEEAS